MLSMIVGKPGSGKSYLAVSKIADMICDWCAFELREHKPFERVLYTNLFLNVEEFQNYVVRTVGEVDVSKYIHHLDDDFFYTQSGNGPRNPRKWWDEVPNKAYLVIDEVHQYMPAGGTGSKDYMQLFTEYVSTHRHREHDLILITQHTDNVNRSILSMATDIFHVVNIKNRVLPVLHIPFADIDVIKEAFGCSRQVANVLYGNYIGRAVKIQSETTIILKPEIFALYKSHTLSEGAEDRPSLKLSRIGSIFWFAKKHWFHLSFKAGLVIGGFWFLQFILCKFPFVLGNSITKTISHKKEPVLVTSVEQVPAPPPSVEKPVVSSEKVSFKEQRERDFFNNTGIYIYGKDFIVTRDAGRVNVGESFNFEGTEVVLESVDFRQKKIKSCPLVPAPVFSSVPDGVQTPAVEGAGFVGDGVSPESRTGGETPAVGSGLVDGV